MAIEQARSGIRNAFQKSLKLQLNDIIIVGRPSPAASGEIY